LEQTQTVAIYSCYTLQIPPPLSSSHELLPVLGCITYHDKINAVFLETVFNFYPTGVGNDILGHGL